MFLQEPGNSRGHLRPKLLSAQCISHWDFVTESTLYYGFRFRHLTAFFHKTKGNEPNMPWQDKSGFGFSHRALWGTRKRSPVSSVCSGTKGGSYRLRRQHPGKPSLVAGAARIPAGETGRIRFEHWPQDRCIQRRDELVLEYYPTLNLKIGGMPEKPEAKE